MTKTQPALLLIAWPEIAIEVARMGMALLRALATIIAGVPDT
jgi:hypothetical protein